MTRTRASSAASKLPLELLIEIFLATRTLHGRDDALTASPPCTYLSHVCRSWRAAAIMCQELWSCLPRPSEAWTKLCLERCYSVPIDCVTRTSHGNASWEVGDLHTNPQLVHRSRTITAHLRVGQDCDFMPLMSAYVLATMSMLEKHPQTFSCLEDFELHSTGSPYGAGSVP